MENLLFESYVFTMQKVYVILCALIINVISYEENECVLSKRRKPEQPDYYWRQYVGVIPDDAIEGGYTATGNRTYIGQIPSFTLPGVFVANIYPGKKEAFSSVLGEKRSHDKFVTILCSNKKPKFEWKRSSVDDMHLLNDYHLILGGYRVDTLMYIGRATFGNEVQVGRVYPKEDQTNVKGLWLYRANGTQENFSSFEILVMPR